MDISFLVGTVSIIFLSTKSLYYNVPCPLDSILDAVLTVSPNKQYLGILSPTTPATQGPKKKNQIFTIKSIYIK